MRVGLIVYMHAVNQPLYKGQHPLVSICWHEVNLFSKDSILLSVRCGITRKGTT